MRRTTTPRRTRLAVEPFDARCQPAVIGLTDPPAATMWLPTRLVDGPFVAVSAELASGRSASVDWGDGVVTPGTVSPYTAQLATIATTRLLAAATTYHVAVSLTADVDPPDRVTLRFDAVTSGVATTDPVQATDYVPVDSVAGQVRLALPRDWAYRVAFVAGNEIVGAQPPPLTPQIPPVVGPQPPSDSPGAPIVVSPSPPAPPTPVPPVPPPVPAPRVELAAATPPMSQAPTQLGPLRANMIPLSPPAKVPPAVGVTTGNETLARLDLTVGERPDDSRPTALLLARVPLWVASPAVAFDPPTDRHLDRTTPVRSGGASGRTRRSRVYLMAPPASPADGTPPRLHGVALAEYGDNNRLPADEVLAAYRNDPTPAAVYLPDPPAEPPRRRGTWQTAALLVLAAAGSWATTRLAPAKRSLLPWSADGIRPPDEAAWS